MAVKRPRQWTARELLELLRAKYSESVSHDWDCRCFLEQVPNGTGGYGDRSWIDAAVIEFWSSHGHTRRAFEIKVARQDFLHEVANRKKNLWCRQVFHEFWFVAPEGVIVSPSEVPEGDGWLAPRGSGLAIKLQAKRRNAKLDDAFVSAISRALLKRNREAEKRAGTEVLAKSVDHQEALAWKAGAQEFLRERGCSRLAGDLWCAEDHAKMVADARKRLVDALQEGDAEKVRKERLIDLHTTVASLHNNLARAGGQYLMTLASLQALLVSGSCDYPGWGKVKNREWKELIKHLEGEDLRPDPAADQLIETARQMIARYDAAKAAAHA